MSCEIVDVVRQLIEAYAAMLYRNALNDLTDYPNPNTNTLCEPGGTSILSVYRATVALVEADYGLVELMPRPALDNVCLTQALLLGMIDWIGGIYMEVTPDINDVDPAPSGSSYGRLAEFGGGRALPAGTYRVTYQRGSMCYYERGSALAAQNPHVVNLQEPTEFGFGWRVSVDRIRQPDTDLGVPAAQTPAEQTQAALETLWGGRGVTGEFGGVLGVYLYDGNSYEEFYFDNHVLGTSSPVFRLERVRQ